MKLKLQTASSAALPQCAQPWKPHGYQKRGVQFVLRQCGAGLLLDPGLGKTSIMLKALKTLLQQHLVSAALCIAPLRVCYNVWPAEAQQWKEFNDLRLSVLHGARKEQALRKPADLYLINPEGLPWLMGADEETGRPRINQIMPDMLIVDESSKFRHTQTVRFKLLKPWLQRFKRRHILTGSPTPKNYLDLFGQIYLLDLGNALGQYITHYRANYFYPTGYMGYDWKLQEGAEKTIQRRIKPLVLRLDADDYLKIPKTVVDVVRITLPDKARKAYDELEEEMITVLEGDRTVTAQNAAVASGKCSQVANGGLYEQLDYAAQGAAGGKGRPWILLHEEKTCALVDIVEELQGEPVLVTYEYDHDLQRIRQALGKNTPDIGKTTPQRSKQIEDRWNAGEIDVMTGHPAAMGHGLNLQRSQCRHIVLYNVPWDYEQYDQLIRRVRRQGNDNGFVVVHHIVASNTVDEAKMRSLRARAASQKSLLDALRSYIREKKK